MNTKAGLAVMVLLAAVGSPAFAGNSSAQSIETRGVAVCGDGLVQGGESCDDGNVLDGDCCTASCQMPTSCRTARKNTIVLFHGGDPREAKLKWRYQKTDITVADLGDPVNTNGYSFCIWDDGALVVDAAVGAGGLCRGQPCWQPRGSELDPVGFNYSDKRGDTHGFYKIPMKAELQTGYISVKMRAENLAAALPGAVGEENYFSATSDVAIQFVRSDDGSCWESVFPQFKKNKRKLYKATAFVE